MVSNDLFATFAIFKIVLLELLSFCLNFCVLLELLPFCFNFWFFALTIFALTIFAWTFVDLLELLSICLNFGHLKCSSIALRAVAATTTTTTRTASFKCSIAATTPSRRPGGCQHCCSSCCFCCNNAWMPSLLGITSHSQLYVEQGAIVGHPKVASRPWFPWRGCTVRIDQAATTAPRLNNQWPFVGRCCQSLVGPQVEQMREQQCRQGARHCIAVVF